jgi:hypothetical protein
MDRRREAALAAGFGLAGAVVALLVLRRCTPLIPSTGDRNVLVAVPVAFAATCTLVAILYEAFRWLARRPRHHGWLYAAAFLGANFAVDWLFLLAGFRGTASIPGASPGQFQAVASFMPLAYLAMMLVPLGCERLHHDSTLNRPKEEP